MIRFFVDDLQNMPLMLPDSLQRAHYAAIVDKLVNFDLQTFLLNMAQQVVWIGIKFITAIVVYMVGRWIIRRVIRLLDIAFERRQVEESLRSFLRNTIKVIVTLILLMMVVQTLGVNVTSIIALFSAATLAIGMALSGTAQNFAGGVMILLMKPYRVGDFIESQGQVGTVSEIKLFSTVITTPDQQTIYIPNNVIATAIIDNYSTAPQRRVQWTISLSYGDDIDVARRVILAMLAEDSRILTEPAPQVWLSALESSSVDIIVRAWVENADYWDVFFQFNERFYNLLPEAGLHFPFPQMDVHVSHEPSHNE